MHDVLILGAGAAGCATALALRQLGHDVVLLERAPCNGRRSGLHLPPDAGPWIDALGLRPYLEAVRPWPCYETRACWGAEEPHAHECLFSPWGHGWTVSDTSMTRLLAEATRDAGARMHIGAQVVSSTYASEGWRIEAEWDGRRTILAARFVVDATGRASFLASRLGIGRQRLDRLVAVTGHLRYQEAQTGNALLVEAADCGWWYSAFLAPDEAVAVLLTDADLITAGELRSPGWWRGQLANAPQTAAHVAGFEKVTLSACAADTSCTRRLSGLGWLAVGDAAFSCDPLSASGIRRALVGGSNAAQTVHADLSGDHSAVRTYARATAADFRRYLAARSRVYGVERRWLSSPFWQRRHQTLPLSESV